jgi:hypothetical protein
MEPKNEQEQKGLRQASLVAPPLIYIELNMDEAATVDAGKLKLMLKFNHLNLKQWNYGS